MKELNDHALLFCLFEESICICCVSDSSPMQLGFTLASKLDSAKEVSGESTKMHELYTVT